MTLKNKKFCFIEITGSSQLPRYARPVQRAAIVCDAQGNVIDEYNETVRPKVRLGKGASDAIKKTNLDLISYPEEKMVLPNFIDFVKEYNQEGNLTIVTYGDYPLAVLTQRCHLFKIDGDILDKHSIGALPTVNCHVDLIVPARKQNILGLAGLGKNGWSLSKVCKILGLDDNKAYDALGKAEIIKQLFFRLTPLLNSGK